jgi:hypothetical protein
MSIPTSDDMVRSAYLAVIKDQVSKTGLTGESLQQAYDRLDATDTDMLRKILHKDLAAEAVRRFEEKRNNG